MDKKRIIRLPELEKLVGLKRSSIYDRIDETSDYHDPTFPRPVPLGGRAVGWVESEVDRWIESRIAARDAKETA